MATAEKLNYLLETKKQIKDAIIAKGVSVENTDSFRSYVSKIGQIESGGGTTSPSTDDWKAELDWWDIETILENDTEDYKQKVICLLTDELDDKATKNYVIGGEKYKLSDGQVIEKKATANMDISTLFDVTKDKTCSKGYKTRYIIYYSNASNMNITLPNNVVYTIFSNVKFNNSPFASKNFMQAIKFINNTEFIGISMSKFYSGCSILQKIPTIDTSNKTNFSNMFNGCKLLQKIPQIDTSSGTDFSYMFSNCSILQQIPQINTGNGTNFSNMFDSCKLLEEMPQIDTSSGTNFSSMFKECGLFKQIKQIDTSNGTDFSYMFYGCTSLKKVPKMNTKKGIKFIAMFSMISSLIEVKEINNITENLNISSSYLNHKTLIMLLNALVDLTGQTSKNFYIGSTNLAKLTDEEKAIATEKNWTLA